MRTFLAFLLLFTLAAVVSGLVTYPVWSALQLFVDVPIHRVMNRVGMLLLAITTVLWLRRRNLANRQTLGYALPRPLFVRQLLLGWLAGVVLMLPLAATLFGLELRTLSPQLSSGESPALWALKLLLLGLLTGATVAFIEETFCRGAMYAAIERESGLLAAIALPTLLYAATHFLDGRLRIPADQVTYTSGLAVTAKLFERYAAPLEFADSFLALCALGVLLGLIRRRTGAIAGCIGVHAGGVCVILVMRNLSSVNPSAAHAWLVGSYDGVIGWLAFGWIVVVASVYWRWSGRSHQSIGPRAAQ